MEALVDRKKPFYYSEGLFDFEGDEIGFSYDPFI